MLTGIAPILYAAYTVTRYSTRLYMKIATREPAPSPSARSAPATRAAASSRSR